MVPSSSSNCVGNRRETLTMTLAITIILAVIGAIIGAIVTIIVTEIKDPNIHTRDEDF